MMATILYGLLQRPEYKNLLEFEYQPDKSWKFDAGTYQNISTYLT